MFFRSSPKLKTALFTIFAGALALAACSATDADTTKRDKDRAGNGLGGPGGPGGPGDGRQDFDPGDDEGVGDGDLSEDSACASLSRSGELVPLDMYVMLDKSASMVNEGDGTRWSSAINALTQFVDSDDSRGMGFGLGYYPVPRGPSHPLPPASCVTQDDCEPYFGLCMPGFNQCVGALAGNDSCMGEDYRKPAVSISLLPMAAGKLKDSLNKTKADGGSTPTYPALEGAHIYAREWALQNPGHVTVVVLATDGEPNNCGTATNTTDGIAGLAEQAFKGSPSVPTYVIGVGNTLGELNQIAAAGGTKKAVYLSDSEAYQGLLDTLNEIRGSVACEYQIPTPEQGKDPDYGRVNVNITAEGETTTIGRVAHPSECDPNKGGWYYDNPKSPNKIMLCHASCELVKSGSQMAPVEVDVLLGCKTKIW